MDFNNITKKQPNCKCARCQCKNPDITQIEFAKQAAIFNGAPPVEPKTRWCWPQRREVCECINCRRMGIENNVNTDNVNEVMPITPFLNNGRLIKQYYHIPLYGIKFSNKAIHCYYE